MADPEKEALWQELMILAQQGDQAAYQRLLGELYPVIQAYLLSKMGPLIAADDATQECLMAIHQARHTYSIDRPFAPWMYAVVRYKSIDILRKTQRQWSREISDDEKVATFADSSSKEETRAEIEEIQGALGTLPVEMQRAVTLTKIEGLSTQEAATQEGVSTTALRTRVSRAIRMLRKRLEKESF